jgi:APA family basic amino acid/polyamine antiporter
MGLNPSMFEQLGAHAVPKNRQPELVRVLGIWEATAIVVASMIGSAIFVVPSQITREVGSARAGVAVWVLSGILSLFGAMSFAELGAMMPQAGGQYVYLRKAYGPLVSFLFGWTLFLAAQSGGIAAVAAGFARYLATFLTLSVGQQRLAAGAVILVLTGINYCGIRQSGRMQSLLTGITTGIVVLLFLLGYLLVRGVAASSEGSLPGPVGIGFLSSFGVAAAAALWAYDGWNTLTFAGGEINKPERNIPIALLGGTGLVIVMYVGLNLLYYHVLTVPEIARSPRVAADAATRILGIRGSQAVAAAIVISAFGSANVSVLAGARVYYAMAQDGLFFGWCAAVHPRFRTPHHALIAQAGWSVLLVSMAGYEQLFTYTVFAAWIFYALTAFGLIVLRWTQPQWPRPYRVVGYPWVPLVFVVTAMLFMANTVVRNLLEAGLGVLLMALGVPVYFFWARKAIVGEERRLNKTDE